MSLLGIVLVLTSAVVHAAWNVAAKLGSGTTSGLAFVWTSNLISVLALTPFAIITFLAQPISWTVFLLGAGVSGVIHFSNFLVLQSSYRIADVSFVYPIARAVAPTVTVIGALVVFAERPSLLALCGAGIVVLGVVVVGGGQRSGSRQTRAVLLGLGVGVLSGIYVLWDSFGVNGLGINPILMVWGFCAVSLLLGSAGLVIGGGLRAIPRAARSAGSAGIISGVGIPLAYAALLWATQVSPTSLVAAGREVSIVLVALAGWLFLHEGSPKPRILGSAVVVVGVVLLMLG